VPAVDIALLAALLATAALYRWTWVSALLGDVSELSSRYAAKYGAHVFVFVCSLVAMGIGQLFDCFTCDYVFMTCTALFAACYGSRASAPV
jgi:hypothetical protein